MKNYFCSFFIVAILSSCSKDDHSKVKNGDSKISTMFEIPNLKEVAKYNLTFFKSLHSEPSQETSRLYGEVYKSREEYPLLKNIGPINVDEHLINSTSNNLYVSQDSSYLESLWAKKTFNLSVPSLGINQQVTVGERLEDIQVLNGTTVKWTPSPTDDYNAIYIEGSFNDFESVMKVVPDNGTFDISPYIQNVKKGTNMDILMRRGNYKVFKDNKGEDHLFYWTSEIMVGFVVQ